MNEQATTIDAINAALRAFISKITGLPENYVIIETRVGPRPYDDRPYCTILWLAQELLPQFDGDITFEQPTSEEDDGIEIRKNSAHCTVRITVRGDNAYNITSELRYAFESSNRAFDLWDVIGYAGITNVTDLSGSYGGKIQQRSFIDFSFYATFERKEPIVWFDELKPNIYGSGVNTLYPTEN